MARGGQPGGAAVGRPPSGAGNRHTSRPSASCRTICSVSIASMRSRTGTRHCGRSASRGACPLKTCGLQRRRGGRAAGPHTRSGGPVAHGANLGSAARSRTIRSCAVLEAHARCAPSSVSESPSRCRRAAPRLLLVVRSERRRTSKESPLRGQEEHSQSGILVGGGEAARRRRSGNACGKASGERERSAWRLADQGFAPRASPCRPAAIG